LLDEIVASKEEAAAETLKRAEELTATGLRLSLVILIAAVLAGLASIYYVKTSYVKPISRLNAFVDGLATGNVDAAAPFSEQPGNIGKLARSIDGARALVNAVDHRLQTQARISQAVPADIGPVLKLIVENAADGPFDPSVLTSARQQEMAHDFTQALSTGFAERTTWELKLEDVPQDLWVYKIDGKLAAFALVLGLNNKQSLERELHAIAVDPAYRGHGIGSEMLDHFCRYFAGRELYLQTRAGSTMMRLATARGFSPFRKIGSEIFLKRPADFGIQVLAQHT
jgi:GNAT superfamily N-acetyltransferase